MMRVYMKDDIGHSIVLLSRVMGLLVTRHLNIWMVHFIETIRTTKMPIDWATILNENIYEKMISMMNDPHFYITSYMVYLLGTSTKDYPRLYRKGSMQDTNS